MRELLIVYIFLGWTSVVAVGVVGCEVRLVRGLADYLVGDQTGCGLGGSEWMGSYRPEWKMSGSLCFSSASSKYARSGLTAFLRLDQSGRC